MIDYQVARDPPGEVRPMVCLDQRQRHVDARSDPGGRPNVSIINEDTVGLDRDSGKARLKEGRPAPYDSEAT